MLGGTGGREAEEERAERQEVGEERAGCRRSKKAGIIYLTSKYFQKQEPKMFFYLYLAYFETSGLMEK